MGRLILVGIALIVLLIASLVTISPNRVAGHELGVRENWSGIYEEPLGPGTHWLFPGFANNVFRYDMGFKVFVMTDEANKEKDAPAFHVQSKEGQDMAISLVVQWRIDPKKLVQLHRSARGDIEDKIVKPTVMRIVKDEATMRTAVDAYSGDGLVKLQAAIEKDLTNPNGELSERGIMVEGFVIEGIKLDDSYIGEIRARQVATQKKSRADEETKAAEALALKAKADAQADYNKQVVEAERAKAVGILKAEEQAQSQVIAAKADAEKVELAAKADKKKVVLAAEGVKEEGILKAQAIEAIGKAEAESAKLKLSAFSVPGSDNYTRIEVAKAMAQSTWSMKGYLPANMSVNVLSENFMRSVEAFLGEKK